MRLPDKQHALPYYLWQSIAISRNDYDVGLAPKAWAESSKNHILEQKGGSVTLEICQIQAIVNILPNTETIGNGSMNHDNPIQTYYWRAEMLIRTV